MPETQPQPVLISALMLTDFLGEASTIPLSRVVLAEDVALGWLTDAVEVSSSFDWSTYAQDRTVRGWVLELAAIAWENPTSLASDASGDVSSQWADRRLQILDSAKAWAKRTGLVNAASSGGPRSRGSFPPAPPGPRWDGLMSW